MEDDNLGYSFDVANKECPWAVTTVEGVDNEQDDGFENARICRGSGVARRREMKALKKKRLAFILRHTRASLQAGPDLSTWEEGQPFYIKYPGMVNTRRWKDFKRRAARKIRHTKDVPNGNAYRKYTDIWGCL